MFRRLEALEKVEIPEQVTVLVSFVAASGGKPVYREVTGIKDGFSNWAVSRRAGESVEALRQRAKTDVPRNRFGAAMLVECHA